MRPQTYLAIVAVRFFLCKGSASVPDALKDDIIQTRHVDFKFDPNKLPTIGITTEKDLEQMYPEGPSLRSTFLSKRTREVNGKIFSYDRVLHYVYMKSKVTTLPGVFQSKGEETIGIVLFINSGIVTNFRINHKIKNDKDEWIQGKYNQTDTSREDWIISSYPGASIDGCIYWLQWPREARYKYIGNQSDGLTEQDCENGVIGPKKEITEEKHEESALHRVPKTKKEIENAAKLAKELLANGIPWETVSAATKLTEAQLIEYHLIPKKGHGSRSEDK